jgi:hypothetical protein
MQASTTCKLATPLLCHTMRHQEMLHSKHLHKSNAVTAAQWPHASSHARPLHAVFAVLCSSNKPAPRHDCALPPASRRAAPHCIPTSTTPLQPRRLVARVVNDAVASAPLRGSPRLCLPGRLSAHAASTPPSIRDATAWTARHLAVPPSPAITASFLCHPPATCRPPPSSLPPPIKGPASPSTTTRTSPTTSISFPSSAAPPPEPPLPQSARRRRSTSTGCPRPR